MPKIMLAQNSKTYLCLFSADLNHKNHKEEVSKSERKHLYLFYFNLSYFIIIIIVIFFIYLFFFTFRHNDLEMPRIKTFKNERKTKLLLRHKVDGICTPVVPVQEGSCIIGVKTCRTHERCRTKKKRVKRPK